MIKYIDTGIISMAEKRIFYALVFLFSAFFLFSCGLNFIKNDKISDIRNQMADIEILYSVVREAVIASRESFSPDDWKKLQEFDEKIQIAYINSVAIFDAANSDIGISEILTIINSSMELLKPIILPALSEKNSKYYKQAVSISKNLIEK